MRLTVLIALILTCASGVRGAGEPLPDFEDYPGVGWEVAQTPEQWRTLKEAVALEVTGEALTGSSALRVTFTDIEGEVGSVDCPAAGKILAGHKGLSVWVKCDGSSGSGTVTVTGEEAKTTTFPLRNPAWRHVTVVLPPAGPNPYTVRFGLTQESPRPAWYILDKVEAVETLTPSAQDVQLVSAADAMPTGPTRRLPVLFDPYISRTRELEEVRYLLNLRKPVTVLVYADRSASGDNLGYVSADPVTRIHYTYPVLFGQRLAGRFGYPTQPAVRQTRREAAGIDEVVFGTLKVVTVIEDIMGARAAAAFQKAVVTHQPTMVVLALGNVDSVAGTALGLRTGLEDCLAVTGGKKSRIPCVLVTNLPGMHRLIAEDTFAREIVHLSRKETQPLADVRAVLLSLGENGWGVYFSDRHRPNATGHALIARVLAELLR